MQQKDNPQAKIKKKYTYLTEYLKMQQKHIPHTRILQQPVTYFTSKNAAKAYSTYTNFASACHIFYIKKCSKRIFHIHEFCISLSHILHQKMQQKDIPHTRILHQPVTYFTSKNAAKGYSTYTNFASACHIFYIKKC